VDIPNDYSVWFLDYLVHLVSATIGSIFVGAISGFLVALPIGFFSFESGSVADLATDSRFFRYAVDGPYFFALILAAFLLGLWSFHRSPGSPSAVWVWVLPTLVVVLTLQPWKFGSPTWTTAWSNLFGSRAEATDSLLEVFVTAPFYTSLAYSAGWALEKWRVFAKLGS
jgi:hypothetical protein